METPLLKSNSKGDLPLLIELAKKLGISAKLLTSSEAADNGIIFAMKEGATGRMYD